MRTILLLFVLFILFNIGALKAQDSTICYSDKSSDTINLDNYNHELFEQVLLRKINEVLIDIGKDTFRIQKILNSAAGDQAIYMAKINKATTSQSNYDKAYTAFRVKHYGGSMSGKELVDKVPIRINKEYLRYEDACANIVERLFAKKKNAAQLLNDQFNLIGIGAYPGLDKKKVYFSIVLGNYKSDNSGTKYKYTLHPPYTDKYYGLTAPHKKYCRRVQKASNIFELQKELTVKGNDIYIDTDNAKNLYKLLRNTKDGVSVDILQKEQFNYDKSNIIDYDNINKGVLLKPTYKNKIARKNKANTEDNRHSLMVKVGKLPKELIDAYELNLVLIQNKSICTSVAQSFLIKTNGNYSHSVSYIPNVKNGNYKPKADSLKLDFRIPFEKNQFTFSNDDIEPYISLLNEPNFIIYKIDLKAYSSIEGNEKNNLTLQKQREQSILSALQERQQEPIETNSSSDYNWLDFKKDIVTTEYKYLVEGSMEEAQALIISKKIDKNLEPILNNHRYAEVKLHARYNIKGENKSRYVINQLNKAIEENNIALAIDIQKYLMNMVMQYNYPDSLICNVNIPKGSKYSSLEMNKLFIAYRAGEISDSLFSEKLFQLHELSPNDAFIAYNFLLSTINHATISNLVENNYKIQTNIERLYSSTLSEELVDALNIKYQMKIITAEDSNAVDQRLMKTCTNKLKEIVNISEETIDNSKKLAAIFIENKEYALAKEALEQWVPLTNNEELLSSYISLCSMNEWDMHTQTFNAAMTTISQENETRFCDLFYSDKFSYRIFENSIIKDLYCKTCHPNQNMATNKN